MGYDLKANNAALDRFHFGAFSFPILLEACGYLWPCIQKGGQWYCAFGVDERMPQGDDYPRLISMDGFPVTAEEARIMARVARNYVAIQRTLPEEHRSTGFIQRREGVTKADVEKALIDAMHGPPQREPWPQKIRDDFTDHFEKFSGWADQSDGFEIR